MKNKAIKSILLDSLKIAERSLEKDLNQDEQSKRIVRYLLDYSKNAGINTIEKLAIRSKTYINNQIHIAVDTIANKVSSAVSALMFLTVGFLIVSVGLVFGAVALSLFIGDLLNSTALGFALCGLLWVVVMIIAMRSVFNKKKIEQFIKDKINLVD